MADYQIPPLEEVDLNEVPEYTCEAFKYAEARTVIADSISAVMDVALEKLKDSFDKQRLNGKDYAQVLQTVTNEALRLGQSNGMSLLQMDCKFNKQLDAELRAKTNDLRQQEIEIAKSLIGLKKAQLEIEATKQKILGINAQKDLYLAQAKGYRDQSKLKYIQLVTDGWGTAFSNLPVQDYPNDFGVAAVRSAMEVIREELEIDYTVAI